MRKRMVAAVLAMVMLLGLLPVMASGTDMTVYVSVSKYGEIVQDKNGAEMVFRPVTLTGAEEYTLDDAFLALHLAYHPDGAEGYQSAYDERYDSISVLKMWGDTSGKFGYQLNSATESVGGGSHPVEDGDLIEVALYQNSYPATEAYATFAETKKEAYLDEPFVLTLQTVDWSLAATPCADATITVNGEETAAVTDENGLVELTLDEAGAYIISAKKSKTLIDESNPEVTPESVPAITAPVCVVTVTENPTLEVIHNIAREYAKSNFCDTGVNLAWILADMMVYESLFPASENCLTDEKKEEALKELAGFLATATRPGDLAKGILAIRSLGYDARNIYTEEFEMLDAVKKLTALVDAKDSEVTNIYTLPYVLLALDQAEGYDTEQQREWLIEAALTSKDSWQSTVDEIYDYYVGTDAMTPMMLALAPYYESRDEVKTALDETVAIVKGEQRQDGLINGSEGYEPASTGLAICGLSALGIDALEIKNGGENLLAGLLATVNDAKNGFPNAFATEQGFRGLLARQLMVETGKGMYDFTTNAMEEANVTGAKFCPVVFQVNAGTATVKIEGKTAIKSNVFDLVAGTYSYTVTASGYPSKTGTVTVTQEEETARLAKTVTITLLKKQGDSAGLSGGGGGVGPVDGKPTEGNSQQTENSGEEIQDGKMPAQMVLNGNTFPDVKEEDWFFTAVKFAYENGLFKGTESGFEPNNSMSRAMLVTVLYRLAGAEDTAEENPFADVAENEWYTDGICWAAKNRIVSGVSETSFAPDEGITREQLAVILYRYAVLCGYDVAGKELSGYQDAELVSDYAEDAVRYAVAKGIISGKTEDTLAPLEGATRAEVATMLMRFTGANK